MARYFCVRCKEMLNTLDKPHLCKDVALRLQEAERTLKREECPPKFGRGRLDDWLKKMDALDPQGKHGPKGKAHDWAIGHHGEWIDQCHPKE